MAHTFEDLRKMTLVQLRDIAKDLEHEAVKGYSQLNKAHLLVAVCQALGVEMHEHHEVVGVNKAAIKSRIRELKKKRDAALVAHNRAQLKLIRRRIHRLKRGLHKATV